MSRRILGAVLPPLLLVLLNTGTFVHATTCYRCFSQVDSGCGDTATSSQQTCDAGQGSCYIFNGTVDGTYVVVRNCSTTVSDSCSSTLEVVGGVTTFSRECYCRSNLCNGNVPTTTTSTTTAGPRPTGNGPLTCYDCSSVSYSECANSGNKSATCSGATACLKTDGYVEGSNGIWRECLFDDPSTFNSGCVDYTRTLNGETLVNAKQCICLSNYCNDALSALRAATGVNLLISTMAAVVVAAKCIKTFW